jgi:hypothetical protein
MNFSGELRKNSGRSASSAKESLNKSEVPAVQGCTAILQLLVQLQNDEKQNRIFVFHALKSPGWTYSEFP